MKDEVLRKIFAEHKVDIPDNGFSERVLRQLPERKSILPQIVMVVFILIGLALMFALNGITSLLDPITGLITSVSRLQAPAPSSVVIYLGFLSMVGIIGYAVVKADIDS